MSKCREGNCVLCGRYLRGAGVLVYKSERRGEHCLPCALKICFERAKVTK